MAPPKRKPCTEHVFGEVISIPISFSEGLETKVLAGQ